MRTNIPKDERGQVLVLTVLCMTILLGFLAFAVDVGLLFNAKRKMQVAADAAATAAALDYSFNASKTSAQNAAYAAAKLNGVDRTVAGNSVTFNNPPSSGYHISSSDFEVIVTQANPTVFMGLFGVSSMTVGARAVAGAPGPGIACVIVLDPHASEAMKLQGSFDVSADKCGVVVDSDASDALQFTGGGGSLSAGYVAVVGGDGGQTGDSNPSPVTGSAPVNNPFPGLVGPNPATDCTAANTNTPSGGKVTSTTVLKTSGNITCFTNAITTSGTVTLPSGVLVFENGVTLGGTVSSGASGTTLDVYGGAFGVGTGSTLNLVAPATAPTATVPSGIALMQPATNTTEMQIQFGSSSGSLKGMIYAPGAELYLQDSGGDKNGGVQLTTDLIVGTLFDKTATLSITSYATSYPGSSALTAVELVE